MANLLAGLLAEHNLIFERRGRRLTLVGPGEPARAVELLRQKISDPARKDIRVVTSTDGGFPELYSLDDWWRVSETGWFDEAILQNRFSTVFQPVVDTTINRVFGHECLIRLESVRNLSGAEIVGAARLCNQVRRFDAHARRLAILSAAERGGPGVFFINVLPESLYRPQRCLEDTLRAIDESGLQPSRFIFEVVSSGGVEPGHLRAIAEAVRSIGCAFGLDDVGSDTPTPRIISELRPEYIKLAAGLVGNVESPACASLVHRLTRAAEQTGTVTIAKNVESARTMENLWLLGVQSMQGHFFGRPSPTPAPQPTDLLNLASALEPPALIPSRCN